MQAAFLTAAIGAPILPQVTASPAAQQQPAVPGAPIQLSVFCSSVIGQLSTEDIPAEVLANSHGTAEGIIVCIHDICANLDRAASKVGLAGKSLLSFMFSDVDTLSAEHLARDSMSICRTSRKGLLCQWARVSSALSARRKSRRQLASGSSGDHHKCTGQYQSPPEHVCIFCLQREKQSAIMQPA